MVEARDPRRREFGTITLAFARVPSAPRGLILQGWNMVDAQNNRTAVRLSAQRFNQPVADSLFTWRDPRRREPAPLNPFVHRRDRSALINFSLRLRGTRIGFSPCCPSWHSAIDLA